MHARCCVEGNPSGIDTSILGTYQTNCVYAPSIQVRVSSSLRRGAFRARRRALECTQRRARRAPWRLLGHPPTSPRLASPRSNSHVHGRCDVSLRDLMHDPRQRAHAHTHTTSQPSHRRLHVQNLAPRTRPSSSLAQLLPFPSRRVGRVAKRAAPDSSSDRALLPWTTCSAFLSTSTQGPVTAGQPPVVPRSGMKPTVSRVHASSV
ncbi:hypothetical protein HETIRDRAFT_451382 [Heterobasidion irregulare TC 32-1]|uniref:Uncharacterized protein n=1 Tax=Heterobasidion irregulare (strain TC 32-1) TaxID=747525 RepID=W4K979_HETIT|nr:uncharacterized protein HETIRDRAFT_451382 [Heterobasidion irregulare TC 32-1]ETW81641.1 hypothetical protein HETIRDRAFT_451382 [Heterobasidion irregulare TC 32-1]